MSEEYKKIIITAIITVISTYFIATYQSDQTRKNLEYQLEHSRQTMQMQLQTTTDNQLKVNQIVELQKKKNTQTDDMRLLHELYLQLNDARTDYYSNQYILYTKEAFLKIHPNSLDYNDAYKNYLKKLEETNTKISDKKSKFLSLLDKMKNNYNSSEIRFLFLMVIDETTNKLNHTGVDRSNVIQLYINQYKITNDADTAYRNAYQEYTKMVNSDYNLPNWFEKLMLQLENETALNKQQ